MPGSSGPREFQRCNWVHEAHAAAPAAVLLKAPSEDIDIEKRLADLELDSAIENFVTSDVGKDQLVSLDHLFSEIQCLKEIVVKEFAHVKKDLTRCVAVVVKELPPMTIDVSPCGEYLRSGAATAGDSSLHPALTVSHDASPWESLPLDTAIQEIRGSAPDGLGMSATMSGGRTRSQMAAKAVYRQHERRQQRTCLQKSVESIAYHSVIMCLVVAQSVGMGVEMQLQMDHHTDVYYSSYGSKATAMPSMYRFTVCLNSVFFLDLALRIVAWKRQFFSPSDESFAWNVFDTFLVTLSILDFVPSLSGTKIGFLRCIRLLRAIRIMRVVFFFHELKKMIYSFFSGTAQLLWVCALLLLVLYVFALAFMQGASEELDSYGHVKLRALRNSSAKSAQHEATGNVVPLLYYFWSIKATMVHLFATITGGREWLDVLTPLMDTSDLYYWLSVFYVFFFLFGFLNVTTGMFVDRAALQIKQTDEEMTMRKRALDLCRVEERIRTMIGNDSQNGEAPISYEQLIVILQDAKIQDWLEKMDVDVGRDPAHVLNMLIPASENSCTIRHFLHTFRLLNGDAKSFDLSLLLFESRRAFEIGMEYNRRQYDDMRRVLDGIKQVRERIGELNATLV